MLGLIKLKNKRRTSPYLSPDFAYEYYEPLAYPAPVISLFLCLILAVGCSASDGADGPIGKGVYVRYVDSIGYTLIRNGKPFRVKGASGSEYPARLAAYGGNTIRVYNPDSLAWILDEAAAVGLAVAADIPLPAYERLDPDPTGRLRASRNEVKELVVKYRDHPALLYWTLGNEVFGTDHTSEYLEAFNDLADLVRELDPEHPVTTALIPHQLIGLKTGLHQVDVDFISLNLFGSLSGFSWNKQLFSVMWNGPYLFSEWGTNGHWEVERTSWQAPIEPSSYWKAEQIREHYHNHIASVSDRRILGSLAFYWGQKHERTPTWFGLFGQGGEVSEMAYTLQNLWTERKASFPGPRIDYLELQGQKTTANILLSPGQDITARSFLLAPEDEGAEVRWKIQFEDWQKSTVLGREGPSMAGTLKSSTISEAHFTAPDQPGPYRLYFQITDRDGYFATANIPFYILKPDHAE